MSGLLFGVGAVAAVVGVVMIGFGIPVNEFSFGNTLIGSGVTAIVGGLIIVALGVVVTQLQRLAEAMATRAPIRSSRPLDMFDTSGARAAPGRVPFPPKTKAESRESHEIPSVEPRMPAKQDMSQDVPMHDLPQDLPQDLPHELPMEEAAAHSFSFAPTLRNPEESPVTVEDDVSLSPQQSTAAPAPADFAPPARPAPAALEPARTPHTTYFDAMWPADSKPEAKPEPEAPQPERESEPRAVAILKSGVVDGMGYTLYVDGSIEAELPQGTLRFASINELRSHLEKNA